MKRCELCKRKARILCESDQASLCWDCDAKVHSANFLVARHSRNLLCNVCQKPTPWSAAGVKLVPTVSFCVQCLGSGGGDSDEEDTDVDADADADAADGEEEEVVEENQVVPWSPPPETENSSSKEESASDGEAVGSRKRCRSSNPPSDEDEDLSCESSPAHSGCCSPLKSISSPPRKLQRLRSGRVVECGSWILDSLRRFHREEMDSGEQKPHVCTLSLPSPSI